MLPHCFPTAPQLELQSPLPADSDSMLSPALIRASHASSMFSEQSGHFEQHEAKATSTPATLPGRIPNGPSSFHAGGQMGPWPLAFPLLPFVFAFALAFADLT